MSEPEKTTKEQERRYKMKGTPIDAYLTENGEFQWTPAPDACSDNEKIREFLDVIKGMPQDRGRVWGTRLNKQETAKRCPLLQQDTSLQRELEEFFAAIDFSIDKPKTSKQDHGDEKANGKE